MASTCTDTQISPLIRVECFSYWLSRGSSLGGAWASTTLRLIPNGGGGGVRSPDLCYRALRGARRVCTGNFYAWNTYRLVHVVLLRKNLHNLSLGHDGLGGVFLHLTRCALQALARESLNSTRAYSGCRFAIKRSASCWGAHRPQCGAHAHPGLGSYDFQAAVTSVGCVPTNETGSKLLRIGRRWFRGLHVQNARLRTS